MLEYHEKPWPHFTGSLPDDFYNHVKTMWDEDDAKKKWNKCKNRSNIIIEDDKEFIFEKPTYSKNSELLNLTINFKEKKDYEFEFLKYSKALYSTASNSTDLDIARF